jgi:RNA polymerase sigma-70 factor, ECF subfamily
MPPYNEDDLWHIENGGVGAEQAGSRRPSRRDYQNVNSCPAQLSAPWYTCGFALGRLHEVESPSESLSLPMIDAQEFETFMRNYQDMVFSTAMRLLANQAEAEDVTQDVFLKAYQRFGELRASKTVGGWLRTVATNLSLNHLSRYRSRWSFFSDLLGKRREEDEAAEIDFPASDDVQADLEQSERREMVEQALGTLPPAQRVPLVLFHMEGLQYDEIATKLGVSLGKVKTDIFRAREALRRKLRLKMSDANLTGAI